MLQGQRWTWLTGAYFIFNLHYFLNNFIFENSEELIIVGF